MKRLLRRNLNDLSKKSIREMYSLLLLKENEN